VGIVEPGPLHATPGPKLVVAVGDCGCDCGIFGENYSPAAIMQAIVTAVAPLAAVKR
jgi:Ni,Fe-hydrogenase III small subunit